MSVEVRDDGRYEVVCKEGHKSITILQEQKFEVLFELGAYAIRDGYYREAVSSFTSSLERFYEFFIYAALLEKRFDYEVIEKMWKEVSNYSERQLGVFVLMYLIECKAPVSLLNNKKVEFRNAVIHKGKIPTRQEALNYGQSVLDFIRPILIQVRSKFPRGIQEMVDRHLKECRKSGDEKQQTSISCVRTIISLSNLEPMDHVDLEDAIFYLDFGCSDEASPI